MYVSQCSCLRPRRGDAWTASTWWWWAAGPAGEVAAGRLADAGLEVALVEDDVVGGECSFYACMPSKALLRPQEILREIHRIPGAAEAVTGELDVQALLDRRDEVIHDLDDSSQLPWLEDRNITLYRGFGVLNGEKRVDVGEQQLAARRAVILSGGHARRPAADRWPPRGRAVDQPRGHHRQGGPRRRS